ncbi:TetR/AcrR family transcriptional regulator [Rhodococcus erythropolis]|uniref:TetR/AcrR family transcriptional regulator n=1 Tax=Rhodococcus erythropolis TaxID=1833 RepID=UPI0037939ACB
MFSEQVHSRAAARDATRRRVLASAERLFRVQGFAATTVREIAADAGVSTGRSWQSATNGLLVSVFGDWVAAVHQARGEPEAFGGSPEEAADAIMGVFAPFLAYFARNPQLSRDPPPSSLAALTSWRSSEILRSRWSPNSARYCPGSV